MSSTTLDRLIDNFEKLPLDDNIFDIIGLY